jgi:hypothetical protein
MTNLTKPFTRRGTVPFLDYGKPLIVSLEPGDILAMHLEGHSIIHRASFSKVFIQLCLWTASKGHREPAE